MQRNKSYAFLIAIPLSLGFLTTFIPSCNEHTQPVLPAHYPTIPARINNDLDMRDYQIEVDMTGYDLYDGKRFIGRINFTGNTTLDSLILKDNL